ncbi:MAG: nicotinate-nucleotide adenylyltransferase [Anaerolineae bacterium]
MGAVARLGVLGGTFDPIHIGHLLMAQAAYETLNLSLVLFVPTGVPPHKRKGEREDAQVRLAMVKAAIEGDCRFAVSTVDMARPAPHYTADMLAILAGEYSVGYDSLYFILGSDSLMQLHTWHHPELVVCESLLAVVHRPGYPVELEVVYSRVPQARGRVRVVEMPEIGISSTLLRAMVREGRSIRYWVPPAVEAIIQSQQLYSRMAVLPTSEPT